jgi:hypothetical protein
MRARAIVPVDTHTAFMQTHTPFMQDPHSVFVKTRVQAAAKTVLKPCLEYMYAVRVGQADRHLQDFFFNTYTSE